MTLPDLRIHVTEDLPSVRATLLDLYADVRAPLLHLPHYSVDSFAERLDRHVTENGFVVAVGFDDDEPIGYAYANAVTEDDRYWARMAEPLADGFTRVSTLALKEIGLRDPWRGSGAAGRIHDALLARRTEQRVTLMVNPLAGDGKVQAVYERWGYTVFNRQHPTPGSPDLVAMIRDRDVQRG